MGVIAAIAAGMALAVLFAVLTQICLANQVASGLALTLLGIGLSGMIGESFVGIPGVRLEKLVVPLLSEIPFLGRILFAQDLIVYFAFLLDCLRLIYAVSHPHWPYHPCHRQQSSLCPRSGLWGDRRALSVHIVGGACAGLAGGYLSLAYTPQMDRKHERRARLDRFGAGGFRLLDPWRVAIGAYLFGTVTILGFFVQGMGWGIPSQFLSSLPYIVTIIALVIISANRSVTRANTPASLGQSFVPDR